MLEITARSWSDRRDEEQAEDEARRREAAAEDEARQLEAAEDEARRREADGVAAMDEVGDAGAAPAAAAAAAAQAAEDEARRRQAAEDEARRRQAAEDEARRRGAVLEADAAAADGRVQAMDEVGDAGAATAAAAAAAGAAAPDAATLAAGDGVLRERGSGPPGEDGEGDEGWATSLDALRTLRERREAAAAAPAAAGDDDGDGLDDLSPEELAAFEAGGRVDVDGGAAWPDGLSQPRVGGDGGDAGGAWQDTRASLTQSDGQTDAQEEDAVDDEDPSGRSSSDVGAAARAAAAAKHVARERRGSLDQPGVSRFASQGENKKLHIVSVSGPLHARSGVSGRGVARRRRSPLGEYVHVPDHGRVRVREHEPDPLWRGRDEGDQPFQWTATSSDQERRRARRGVEGLRNSPR